MPFTGHGYLRTMRINLPTLVLAALLPTGSIAQTLGDNFVSITVSDTVPVRITGITYQITPQDPEADKVNYDENTDYDKMMREQSERTQKVADRLKKDLEAAHFTLTDGGPPSSDPYTISSYNTGAEGANTTVQVALKDEPELKKLVAWLRQRGGVDGSVTRWDYARSDQGAPLMRSLYDQARAQAQQLADLGGRKLGKLLSAEDPQQRQMTFTDFLSAIAEREHGSDGDAAMARMRMRSMVFRFALTD